MKILIADDSRVMRQIVTRTLRQAGFGDHDLVEAADGKEALDMATAEKPDLVILAGFMRILTPAFVNRYLGRLVNIHPSLLPKYPGLHTHQRALDAGDAWHGATVHFVTAELDGGPAIIQGKVAIEPEDTPDSLAKRVLAVEHVIYPQAVQWFCAGALHFDSGKSVLNGAILPATGVMIN